MEVINQIEEMRLWSQKQRAEGRIIAFVPTMGYFHDGHLSLMREGKKRANCLVVSIFVNPTQFGVGEDFDRYPRDLERDRKLAEKTGVDVMFVPNREEMYPENYQTYVTVEEITKDLCGRSRPGHFRGVATVCLKLFNIVNPHLALFGKKDFQQLMVIKRMVKDLNLNLEIIAMPTVREPDGLAMSSRNTYLKVGERMAALSLSRSLLVAKRLYDSGEREASRILAAVESTLVTHPEIKTEYIKICDIETLKEIPRIDKPAVIALAVKIGETRLIDNYVFGEPLEINN